MFQDDEKTAFELRFEIIKAMPEGEQKTKAMEDLFKDYPGLMSQAQDEIDKGFDMAYQASPQATPSAPGNPYSVTVAANPLEHMAVAGQRVKGQMDMNASREEQRGLSQSKKDAAMAMGQAALQQGQAAGLRSRPGARGPVGPDGLTDEERRQRQMMMMRSYT
jgi:hypothetical protein